MSKNKIFVFLLLISLLFIGCGDRVESTGPALGLYGTLSDTVSSNRSEEYAQIFAASPFDWHMTQYEPDWLDYNLSPHSHVLRFAGKRVILRTWFWNAIDVSGGVNWTDIYNDINNDGELYGIALAEIISQVNMAGVDNLYAITINEEEPAAGYGWKATEINVDHFIFCYNNLYDDVKAAFPSLRVLAALSIDVTPGFCADILTDEQVCAIKKDGLETHVYWSDLNWVEEFYIRIAGFRSDLGDEIYTLIWCSTPSPNEEQSRTPDWTSACFELAKNAGIPNVGFYAEHRSDGSHKWLFFNEFDPDPGVDDVHNPYGFREVLLDIVGNND